MQLWKVAPDPSALSIQQIASFRFTFGLREPVYLQ